MIASSAELAICRPKLSETFFAPNAVGVDRPPPATICSRADSVLRQRLGPDLERSCSRRSAPRRAPGSTALPWPIRSASGTHVLERDRLRSLERELRAALEVDAEVEPLDSDRDDRDRHHDAGDREPDPPPADVVDLQPARDAAARRADQPRVVEPAEACEQRQERARREDGGEHRDRGADQEHQGEPADARRSRPRTARAP